MAVEGKSWSSQVLERIFIVNDVMTTLKIIRLLLQDIVLCQSGGEIKTLLVH